jgi:hypothetical protein
MISPLIGSIGRRHQFFSDRAISLKSSGSPPTINRNSSLYTSFPAQADVDT